MGIVYVHHMLYLHRFKVFAVFSYSWWCVAFFLACFVSENQFLEPLSIDEYLCSVSEILKVKSQGILLFRQNDPEENIFLQNWLI